MKRTASVLKNFVVQILQIDLNRAMFFIFQVKIDLGCNQNKLSDSFKLNIKRYLNSVEVFVEIKRFAKTQNFLNFCKGTHISHQVLLNTDRSCISK